MLHRCSLSADKADNDKKHRRRPPPSAADSGRRRRPQKGGGVVLREANETIMINRARKPDEPAMSPDNTDNTPQELAELKRLIRHKWPEAAGLASERLNLTFSTGLPPLDAIFPNRGIPCGQLIELTGGLSSGKTTLLLTMLAALTRNGRAVYIDLSRSFFPASAAACGIDLNRLLTVTPASPPVAVRAAELLLHHNAASWIVLDLVGQKQTLPTIMLHRLRLKAVRARGLVLLLTENNSDIIPSSTASLRLEVSRKDDTTLTVDVTRSRLSREGLTIEVPLP